MKKMIENEVAYELKLDSIEHGRGKPKRIEH